MSSTFPSILTSYTDPLSTQRLNSPSHSGIETNQNSGLKQLEAVIGVAGASSVVGTYEYFVKSPASNGGGHIQTANKGGTGQTTFTKGDLLVASSSSVLGKLSVGSNTNILIADSTQSVGIKWGPVVGVPAWVDEGTLTWASSSAAKTVTLSTTYDIVKCFFYTSVINGLTITVNSLGGTAYDYRRITSANAIAVVTGASGWDMGTVATAQHGGLLEINFTGKHSNGEKGFNATPIVLTDNLAHNASFSGRVSGDSNNLSTITFTPSGNFVGTAHFYGLTL